MSITLDEAVVLLVPSTLTESASGEADDDLKAYMRKNCPVILRLIGIASQLNELGVSIVTFYRSTILPAKAEEEFQNLQGWLRKRRGEG